MNVVIFILFAACLEAQLTPGKMAKVGTVDERFLSYNVEMVEVTGGRFWAPYKKANAPAEAPPPGASSIPGLDPSAFRSRPPINLAQPRLRMLAAALGPAYVRVSGTWANSTYFHDSDAPAPTTPPKGFGGLLTRAELKGVIDFSKAVNAKLITSFAISDGVRDDKGVWTDAQAKQFVTYIKAAGGSIAAAELFNEPSFAAIGGAPKGYDAAAYGRDFKVFRAFAKANVPDMKILGPGSVGEATSLAGGLSSIKSDDMLRESGPGVDVFSYHYYGGVSKRCAGKQTTEGALSEAWLSAADTDRAFYAGLRDKFEPGKPLWLTETGETACGGNPWAATFLDSFRYLDQLGRLAKQGVRVVAHNTLAASDYALIDEDTLTPRPNYWSALLWHRMMGTTVLDAGASPAPTVHLYAQCLRGKTGGVAELAINTDRTGSHDLDAPMASERYTMTGKELTSGTVELNGHELKLAGEALPKISGAKQAAGKVTLAPASITFLAFGNAGNASCR